MFGLLIFGPKIEMTMGSKRFLKFYLICGIGASLFYLMIMGLGSDIPMLGASGAIFGVLTAYGLMYPRDIVYVYFSIPMPAIVFIILYGGLQVLLGVLTLGSMGGGIAYFGHVGGLVTAIILLKFFGYERRKIRYFWE
jgi:membrane associated rhomboid family serine protease